MIFIWKGRGFLTVLVLVASFLILLFTLPDGNATLGFTLPLFISGVFSFIFGNKWNNPLKYYIDPKSGKKAILRNQHTLFWINMEYWGIILIVIGMAFITKQAMITFTIGAILLAFYIIYKYKKNNQLPLYKGKREVAETSPVTLATEEVKKESAEEIMQRKKDIDDPARFMPK